MISISPLPITFTDSTPKKIKNIFFDNNQQDLSVIQSKFIQLPMAKKQSREVQEYFSEETFPYIKEWEIKELRCSKKLYPLILFQISHISFEHLTFLHLSTCYIESIESISWLEAPNLQQLSLDDNDIRSIKPLQKTNFKRLQFLSCYNNFFLHDQIKQLTRMKLGSENMSHIKLGRANKKKLSFIEGLLKIEAGQKINASIGYTQFSSMKKFQQIGNRFPASFTSMVEGEVWMPGQEEFLEDDHEDEEEQAYFPYLNF